MTIQPIGFEEWRPVTSKSVPDVVEGAYIVSNTGKVYSNLTKRLLTLTKTWNGYYRVILKLNSGIYRYFLIHRIVLIEFNCCDNYKNLQVNHKDCDKSNNDEFNLEWMTCSENILHAYQNGVKTKAKGEDCSYATITNEQADLVGQLLSTRKYTHKEISDITGIPKHIIGNISCGTTWRFVYEKYNLSELNKQIKIKFTDEQLNILCKYFELNKYKYSNKSDLYRDALMTLFGIEYDQGMSATMSRIYNHKTRTEITNKYNF